MKLKTKEDQLRYIRENQKELERLANEAHEEMRWIWYDASLLTAWIFAMGFFAGVIL